MGRWCEKKRCFAAGLAALLLAAGALPGCAAAGDEPHTAATFAMSTLVSQRAWGENAQVAMRRVNEALAEWEARLSLFGEEGDISRVNAAAGAGGAEVAPETAALLRRALALSAGSEGAFAVTIAPLTLAWGVTSDAPRVPPQSEIDALLPLVDDGAVAVEQNHVSLPRAGMALDLGGIAKGAACGMARDVYTAEGVDSALLSIGGNVYAHGTHPDGSPFRVGFADPSAQNAYIASFELRDAVVAVSGGYERYFEVDGKRYIHIFDPATGYPAESDILSVGVIHPDGAAADFWSTTLFVWGLERALGHMRAGGVAILLDHAGTLYVSSALRGGFALNEDATGYRVVYVEQEAAHAE